MTLRFALKKFLYGYAVGFLGTALASLTLIALGG